MQLANQLTGFYLIRIFKENFFPNRLLKSEICSNFTLRKSTLNMTKFASLKKIHTKIIIVKRNIQLNDLGFLGYSTKACPDLSGLQRLIFQSSYHTSLIITKTGNYYVFCGILVPHFKMGKMKPSDRAYKCCNSCHLQLWRVFDTLIELIYRQVNLSIDRLY